MKTLVLSHGDCDGVISAALYVKHFLIDIYPSNVIIGFTQPWRASKEISRLCREDCEKIILLDIAIDKEVVSALIDHIMKGSSVLIIDHHMTTSPWINKLKELGVNIIWSRSTSTPRLMFEKLGLTPNTYEEALIDIADACEGSEPKDPDRKKLGDLLKLAISRDSSDMNFMRSLFELLLKGRELKDLEELKSKAKISRMLLDKLIEKILKEGENIGEFILLSLKPAESRIYAGLFGIASTEAGKKIKRDIVLIRDEDGKIVVTIRSFRGKALEVCRQIIAKTSGGKYGGHSEAASATINKISLDKIVEIVRNVLWNVESLEKTTIK